jgi:sulfate adenylyltransferase large subunit
MTPLREPTAFSLDDFVAQQERKGLLRFVVCGSVDHGKSTLIGRLLYESKLLFDDQLDALAKASRNHGTQGGNLDLALVLDGLAAEREQKITIDVAYRFFTTERRKFIVVDAPGHEQYTRNMATGASTADLALILVSAETGLTRQTKRHTLIVSTLGVRQLVIAVNKMDLVGWSRSKFAALEAEFRTFVKDLQFDEVVFVPVAACSGDNVVTRSNRMDWYCGLTLVEHLEEVQTALQSRRNSFRMPVQWVNRPHAGFRGYSGLIAGGEVHPDMPVQILPSGQWTRVERIVTADGDLAHAVSGQAVTLTLVGDVDASRGDVIAEIGATALVADRLCVHLVWMGEDPLTPGKPYLLKLATCMATAIPEPGLCVIDLDTRKSVPAKRLAMNEIGTGILELDRRIAVNRFIDDKETGSFILIDPETCDTVGMGIVDGVLQSELHRSAHAGSAITFELLPSTESHARSVVKAASWRATGSFDTFIIAAFITGSPKAAGAVALIEIATKTALYYLHERIWILIQWGKRAATREKFHAAPRVDVPAEGPGNSRPEATNADKKSGNRTGISRSLIRRNSNRCAS